jgi:alpha-mannosidase
MAGVHDDRRLIERRIQRALFERIVPAVHGLAIPLAVEAWTAPGEPVEFAEAMRQQFEPFAVGQKWARPWGTTWFRMRAAVPAAWPVGLPVEAVIDLGFRGIDPGFQAEGLVWNADGSPRAGIHPDRRAVRLPDAAPGEEVELIVEAAANPGIGSPVTPMGAWDTAGDRPLYTLRRADLAVFRPEVAALGHDVEVLDGTMKMLRVDDPRRIRLLRTLERAMDMLDLDDVPRSAPRVRAVLAEALAVPARASAHRVVAVGHAHIDSAWLWPARETVRKCARTFASAIELIEQYPQFRFVCSQAAQYAWIEARYPRLFERITEQVKAGRFVPVGGMWVEADMNLPSGESIVRQLVHGQRYFEARFGVRCTEVWIPDVFGYPASLPQIFAAAGCHRFVTQKLSWNKQNALPHHTFRWTGLDGTSVLTHFPPVDTYNAKLTPVELAYAAANFRDAAWSDWSLVPFGHGDGGGGPTREMLERATRAADLDGLPRVDLGTVEQFFDHVETDIARDPAAVPEWHGELYFEMHRGTFTSQSRTKVGNRRAERLLREAELWWAYLDGGPRDELDELWKATLFLQFHDIIPGSSIAWVHQDAEREHERVNDRLEAIILAALEQLAIPAGAIVNTATHARDEIAVVPDAPPDAGPTQPLQDGRVAFRAAAPGLALAPVRALEVSDRVDAAAERLRNALVDVSLDARGHVVSLVDVRRGRQCLPHGARAAVVELAPDFPNEFDAWDLEHWARRNAVEIDDCRAVEVLDRGPLLGAVRVTREFGSSRLAQTYVLRAGSARLDVHLAIDWHERERLLSIAFPLDVHADVARCDIQFGHVARPTHANTSWDAAKFEVCAHRWADLSEPDFGVAVLNDGRYGHAVQHGAIRVSLQRGARYPDPFADEGRHEVTISVLPHGPGLVDVVHEAEALNLPLRVVTGRAAALPPPLVSIDAPGVLVSALKRADDNGDLVLRAYEALGSRAACTLPEPRVRTDLLETPIAPDEHGPAMLTPFELATWRLYAARP